MNSSSGSSPSLPPVTAGMASSQADNKERHNSSGLAQNKRHGELLKKHWVRLVEELQPELFLHMLDDNIKDNIDDDKLKKDKTRTLLEILMRYPKESFDGFCKVIAGLYPELFKLLRGQWPTSEESDCYLKPFSDKLREGILNTGSKTDNAIDPNINLDTQFVTLRLADITEKKQDDQVVNEDKILPKEYQYGLIKKTGHELNISDILPKKEKGKSVLITGRAGVGKSTLIQYANRQWAKHQWATSYTAVFILNLRRLANIQREMTLSQLLGMYADYVPDPLVPKQPSAEWIENNQEKVLFITDGIDELSDITSLLADTPKFTCGMSTTPLDWCINLMRRNLFRKSTLLLVSRPFKGLVDLRHDMHVDVLGLTPDKVMRFVDVNVRSERQRTVKETLLKNPVLLSACSITFYAAAITSILEEDEEIYGEALTTYTRITAFIITRLALRKAKTETSAFVLSDNLSKCIPNMAALAYKGLSANKEGLTKLLFSGRELEEAGFLHETVKQARETGLLLCTDMIDPLEKTKGQTLQAEFIHLSVQELLAAADVLTLDVHQDENYEQFVNLVSRFNLSKLFLHGLALDKESKHIIGITKGVMKEGNTSTENDPAAAIDNLLIQQFKELCKSSQDTKADILEIVQIAHETQRADFAKEAGKVLAPAGKLALEATHLTAVDLKALFFTLQHSFIEELSLSGIWIDDASAMEIKKYLSQSTNLKVLELSENMLSEEGMRHISAGILSSTSLNDLRFRATEIMPACLKHLTDAVKSSKTLKMLRISMESFSHENTSHISNVIKTPTSLKQVHLSGKTIQIEGMKHLSDALASKTTRLSKAQRFSVKL